MFAKGETNIELIKVSNRVYRKARTKLTFATQESLEHEDYEESQVEKVQEGSVSSYKMHLNIPPIFFKFLIGKKSATKLRIQKESGATLIIPKSSSEKLLIKGPTEQSISSAKTRISFVIDSTLKLIPFTHFLSAPLATEQDQKLKKSVTDFFDQISAKYSNAQGFHKSILTNPNHLHLTITMLKLFEGQEDFDVESQNISLKKAATLLQQLRPKCYDLIGTRSIVVKMRGLEIMNDDPKRVDVLYAKVQEIDGGNRLQKLCDFLAEEFTKAGFVSEQPTKNVKVKKDMFINLTTTAACYFDEHKTSESATNDGQKQGEDSRIPFDASTILKDFADFEFGQVKLDSVQLSDKETATDTLYWKSLFTIQLP